MDGLQDDRLAGAGLSGEHHQTVAEVDAQLLDEGEIRDAQFL